MKARRGVAAACFPSVLRTAVLPTAGLPSAGPRPHRRGGRAQSWLGRLARAGSVAWPSRPCPQSRPPAYSDVPPPQSPLGTRKTTEPRPDNPMQKRFSCHAKRFSMAFRRSCTLGKPFFMAQKRLCILRKPFFMARRRLCTLRKRFCMAQTRACALEQRAFTAPSGSRHRVPFDRSHGSAGARGGVVS